MSSTEKQQVSSIKSSSKPDATPEPVVVRKDAEAASTAIADSPAEEKSTAPKPVKENLTQEKNLRAANTKSESTLRTAKVSEKLPKSIAAVHAASQTKKSTEIPRQMKLDEQQKVNVDVPGQIAPRPAPPLNIPPLVLATHLVPSLPIGLFQLLAEAIEAATQLPVSLLYEPRSERPVAENVTDLAILPAYSEWKDGDLFPVTFVFAHRMNDSESGNVYVDIVVVAQRFPYVKDIMDFRGHRCALPDRRQRRGAASILFGHLRDKGESPAFFANTLDTESQVATLQMVAGRQVDVGVVEAPVFTYHRRKMPGVSSLINFGSLGPLPPYAIYVKKSMSAEVRQKISSYLLNLKNDDDWLVRFAEYGIIGFTTNSPDAYLTDNDEKEVVTSVRYY